MLLRSTATQIAQAKELPVMIVINEEDCKVLGGWPLDRKWYAIALQKLSESGASRIFLDLAFPHADVAHPESDDFFFYTLQTLPNTYLLARELTADSITILSDRQFPAARCFLPFSEAFDIKSEKMMAKSTTAKTLASFFYDEPVSGALVIDLPKNKPIPDYSLREAIQGQVNCQGRDAVIYLDYAGVSSLVVSERSGKAFTTAELEVWAAMKVASGDVRRLLPAWQLGALLLLALLPVLYYLRKTDTFDPAFYAIGLNVLVFVGLTIAKVDVSPLWFGANALPVMMIIGVIIARSRHTLVKPMLEHSVEKEPQTLAPIQQAKIESKSEGIHQSEDLRYRLEFYEHLSHRLPPELPQVLPDAEDIYFAPNSPMVTILTKAEQVAKREIPILILGESGVGKEKLAQFIHRRSARREKAFIAINCGALNENLIESELFGYEAGAFTGATKAKAGRFEQADGGTLFLDEIGETSLAFQVKLLRVLQEGTFERVGGTKTIRVSVRVIAATHQSLEKLIAEKRFREDLFYRLNGFSLTVPPLRERPMDIEVLFTHFLHHINPNVKISDALLEWLKAQAWRGNVRELKAATERAVLNAALYRRDFLLPEDFELKESAPRYSLKSDALAEKILQALRQHEFKHRAISAVATELGLHRATVTEYLRGWVIHFYNQSELLDEVCEKLRGTLPLRDEGQFHERIKTYIDGVLEKIQLGIDAKEPDEVIRTQRFRNLPSIFEMDLSSLIQKARQSQLTITSK
ncbi:MAG: sigma 54-interacting transcriptional regulator [Candidatus Thermochlorobacter sp.]